MTDQIKYRVLDEVILNTDDFIATVPKSQRKKFGQFFTTPSVAKFMATLFDIDLSKPELRLLDAGAGTGILCTALIDHIFELGYAGKIFLTCYETDTLVLPVLKRNLILLKETYDISFKIIEDNYITSQFFGINTLLDMDRSEEHTSELQSR